MERMISVPLMAEPLQHALLWRQPGDWENLVSVITENWNSSSARKDRASWRTSLGSDWKTCFQFTECLQVGPFPSLSFIISLKTWKHLAPHSTSNPRWASLITAARTTPVNYFSPVSRGGYHILPAYFRACAVWKCFQSCRQCSNGRAVNVTYSRGTI